MKNIVCMIMLLAFISGAGCSSNTTEKQPGEEVHNAPATEATPALAYICPMECEGSASHEPGKCPVCSMDLVKNPNYQAPDSTAAEKIN